VKDELVKSAWVDPDKLRVVYNGVEASPVDVATGRLRLTELGIPPGARVICAVGRLVRSKGFDLLIDAFARVIRDLGTCHLLIVGEGDRRRELERQVRTAGLAERVSLPGHRDGIREILSAVDVFVLSSRFEGMANTLLEAMSVGAPIVATDIAGTSEAVVDGVDALVVPPGEVDALADAVQRIVLDTELAGRLGRSALERVRERFATSRMVSDLEELLYQALSSRTRGRAIPARRSRALTS
jgi:glycosyltransferase involved in cell wall biosynthesis